MVHKYGSSDKQHCDIATVDLCSEEAITRRDFVQRMNTLLLAISAGALVSVDESKAAAAEGSAPIGPRKVRLVENFWIPMQDGTRIAARLWLPEDAEQQPVPAIMEYVPRCSRTGGDIHPYLASHGYACLEVDVRGSGDSDGLPQDEYVRQEQDDGVEIIGWLAAQSWCTGKVGMFGLSYGGFSSLQVAARRPPALKAIITHCSTDDRYADDAHYTGGCINDCMFHWGSIWTTLGLIPPDPAVVGERWREQWLKRLESRDFYLADWLMHQQRDAFWKHASVNEDYGSITCAVYAVGGWTDPYCRTIPRMLANLKCPRKGLVGPWKHQYPHNPTAPHSMGPAIDWLTEGRRWWDYWLKGIETGVMDEPMYRVWMQETPVMLGMQSIPGRWVAEETWPSARIYPHIYYLTGLGLERQARAEGVRVLKPLQTVGMTAPRWALESMLPTDQRVDDARSLTFDSAALTESLEILGAPAVTLELAVDKPVAFLIARLNEVEPDGVSKRLTYGVLNLTQRRGDEVPEPLQPGQRYHIRIQLHDCAQKVKAGHRIRLALSTTYWPMVWPSPEPVTLTLYTGKSQLELPARPPLAADARLRAFGAGSPSKDPAFTVIRPGKPESTVFEWDPEAQKLVLRTGGGGGRFKSNATGIESSFAYHADAEILDNDPTSAKVQYGSALTLERGNWSARCESTVRMSLTKDELHLTGDVKAYDHDEEIFARAWNQKIPRKWL